MKREGAGDRSDEQVGAQERASGPQPLHRAAAPGRQRTRKPTYTARPSPGRKAA